MKVFLAALRREFGAVHAKVWLHDASLGELDDRPVLYVATSMRTAYIRSHFESEVRRASVAAALSHEPLILPRTSRA